MRAVRIHRFGDGDRLSLDEIDRPVPDRHEVLVRTIATSVNPIDLKIRAGLFAGVRADHLPFRIGCDVAGHVEAVGDQVSSFRVGDAVYGMTALGRGTYADYVLVQEHELAIAPSTLALVDAAAVPVAALTAWQGLATHGALQPGQRVLIHGGTGGVGHFAVQLARAAGAIVFATGSPNGQRLLTTIGADTAIDYRTTRFEDVVSDIDLVLDLVGGAVLDRSWTVLNPDGRIVSAVDTPDASSRTVRHPERSTRFVTRPSGTDLARIGLLIDSGQIRPVISSCYPLAEAAAAHAKLAEGGTSGKIVLRVRDDDAHPGPQTLEDK